VASSTYDLGDVDVHAREPECFPRRPFLSRRLLDFDDLSSPCFLSGSGRPVGFAPASSRPVVPGCSVSPVVPRVWPSPVQPCMLLLRFAYRPAVMCLFRRLVFFVLRFFYDLLRSGYASCFALYSVWFRPLVFACAPLTLDRFVEFGLFCCCFSLGLFWLHIGGVPTFIGLVC